MLKSPQRSTWRRTLRSSCASSNPSTWIHGWSAPARVRWRPCNASPRGCMRITTLSKPASPALEHQSGRGAHQSLENAQAPDVWPCTPRSPQPSFHAGPTRRASACPTPAGAIGHSPPGRGGRVSVPDRGGGRGGTQHKRQRDASRQRGRCRTPRRQEPWRRARVESTDDRVVRVSPIDMYGVYQVSPNVTKMGPESTNAWNIASRLL
jgi:hypothetical protein